MNKMLKISVVMPSFLGDYPNAASDRVMKFRRAVNSFINQSYPKEFCELIVIADGCDKTIQEIGSYWEHGNIKWTKIHKCDLFSGTPRAIGLKYCTDDVICYLDSDDYFDVNHLQNIANEFKKYDVDWIAFNDTIIDKLHPVTKEILVISTRRTDTGNAPLGTSNIAHKNLLDVSWEGMNGYGHDLQFIQQLITKYPKSKHGDFATYLVCHVPNQVDT